jgi:Fe-S cluster assembly iron-binding protein IscA
MRQINQEDSHRVRIFIEYVTTNNVKNSVELKPDEYFDEEYLDEDEEISWDSVPMYNHAVDYLDNLEIDLNAIVSTKLVVIDSKLKVSSTINESFWNEAKNVLIERIDRLIDDSQTLLYRSLIISIQIQKNPLISEILRLEEERGIFNIRSHVFLEENKDKSEDERKIYP